MDTNENKLDFIPETIQTVINEVAKPIPQPFPVEDALVNGVSVIAVPEGYSLQSTKDFITPLLKSPPRRQGKSTHATAQSLTAHIQRYKSEATVLFASQKQSRLTAVYNYHPEGSDHFKAGFGDHAAILDLEKSDELKEWQQFAAAPHSPEELAFFLEKRGIDLISMTDVPDSHKERLSNVQKIGGIVGTPEQLINTIPSLKIMETSEVQNAVNISSGECSIVYKTEHTASSAEGEKVTIPGWIMIAIPLFKKGPLDVIPVRLRYRKSRGTIAWSVDLLDIQKYVEEYFEQIVNDIAGNFNLPLFNGEQEGRGI